MTRSIRSALEAVWRHEVYGTIIKLMLTGIAVAGMVILATIVLTGWIYMFLLIICG